MNDLRPWVYAALFGSLWGALESTLGTVLKLIPAVPAGTAMAAVGVVCMVTARRLAPAVGGCVATGLAAALVMTFSLGGLRPGSLIAVLLEALLVETAMTATRSSFPGAAAGGALALAVTPLQKTAVLLLIAGPEAARAYAAAATSALDRFGADARTPLVLIAAAVAAAAVAGAVAGSWAWRLAGRVARRLGGTG